MAEIHDECGVLGIYRDAPADAASMIYYGLYALQHRGQSSCGIAVSSDGVLRVHRDSGLVPEVFTPEVMQSFDEGRMAIGHVRYGTAETASRDDAQPMLVRHVKGAMALCYNGAVVNAQALRRELELRGAIFHTNSDLEVFSYAITRERLTAPSIETAVERAVESVHGAYSLLVMSARKLIACRDPEGIRPLCLGRSADAWVVSSESCALDSLGARFVRDLEPGEILVIDENGPRSIRTHCGRKGALCIFEFVYFARPDSVIEGVPVHEARKRAGAFLAQEHPVDADVVVGVPDSGLDAALGYARESGIPYGVGFIKNRYVGRTFIQPTQRERENLVRIKLNVLAHTVRDKRVVMIDDSIVRGTTTANIVRQLRQAGAREVHVRISSPPFMYPCCYGTDVDSSKNLIACRLSVSEICREIGADSLGYLGLDDLHRVAAEASCGFCDACFTGRYPTETPPPPDDLYSLPLSLKKKEGEKP